MLARTGEGPPFAFEPEFFYDMSYEHLLAVNLFDVRLHFIR